MSWRCGSISIGGRRGLGGRQKTDDALAGCSVLGFILRLCLSDHRAARLAFENIDVVLQPTPDHAGVRYGLAAPVEPTMTSALNISAAIGLPRG